MHGDQAIYALCLLGASYNHWDDIVRHGPFWNHGGFPAGSAAFWTTLAVVDPAAVLLLFARPNVGIVTTATIMVADVLHNVWIEARYFPPLLHGLAQAPQVVEQIGFMIFVMLTAPLAWKPSSAAS